MNDFTQEEFDDICDIVDKCCEERIEQLEKERDELAEVVKAVAHIGIDFGYGAYEIEDKYIESARKLINNIERGE